MGGLGAVLPQGNGGPRYGWMGRFLSARPQMELPLDCDHSSGIFAGRWVRRNTAQGCRCGVLV